MLDIEPCDRLAGRSGTQGHGIMVVEVIYGPGPGPHRESGRTIWCRHCPVEAYPVVAFIGSSELSVGGSVDAFCDEEHSELVVGGVAVLSGGAYA